MNLLNMQFFTAHKVAACGASIANMQAQLANLDESGVGNLKNNRHQQFVQQ